MFKYSMYKATRKSLIIICASFALSHIAYAENLLREDTTRLSGDEIIAKLIGNSVTGFSVDTGVSFTVYYPEYGKLRGEAGPWGIFTDEGVWVIKDNKYCVTWKKWSDEELCFSVYLDGDAISWVKPDGKLLSTDTLLTGNPAGL